MLNSGFCWGGVSAILSRRWREACSSRPASTTEARTRVEFIRVSHVGLGRAQGFELGAPATNARTSERRKFITACASIARAHFGRLNVLSSYLQRCESAFSIRG